MVSSNDMLVNNETTSYETYSSTSGNRFIISAKEIVSLMEYLLLQRGLKLKKKEKKEKNMIKNKFKKADFPTKFIDSVIKDFEYNEIKINKMTS